MAILNLYSKSQMDDKLMTSVAMTESATPGHFESTDFVMPDSAFITIIGINVDDSTNNVAYGGCGLVILSSSMKEINIPIGSGDGRAKVYYDSVNSKLLVDLFNDSGTALSGVSLVVTRTTIQGA